MKKSLLLFVAMLLSFTANANIKITDGGKYRIVCAYNTAGCVALGTYHNAVPYLYYVTNLSSTPDDGWWTVRKDGNGYTLCNAASNQYITYVEGRPTNNSGQYLAKGLQLTNEVTSDATRWTFIENSDGSVVIRNVQETGQYFNLRTDNTWLVGTYNGSYDENSHFYLYDTSGQSIVEGGSSGNVQSGTLSAYADSLRLGGKALIYDSSDRVYYAAIPQSARGGADLRTTLTLKPALTDGTYSLRLGDLTPDAQDSITIPAVSCSEPYTLSIVKDSTETVASTSLYLTFLPIVEVNVASCNGSYYNTGTIRVTDPDVAGYDSTFIAAFKYRGATAQNYAKKSYAIKLRDANGESVDREFFGLRNDNNWILDAMAIDYACMRNRVSTDLWNDFATKPYHRRAGWEKKAKAGTRGTFVEVFLNGSYHGLYCMTEKVDRKQLRLKKFVAANTDEATADTIHGSLFKSTQWSYEVFMGHESDYRYFPKTAPESYNNNNGSESWGSYEVKYPDWEEEKIDWGPLWNAVNFVATSSDTEFNNGISEWFDFPVLKDYYLFIELMLASDNHGKNIYFFNYDQLGSENAKMIGIAPWDLDGTWGRRWDSSSNYTGAEQDFNNFLWNYEHGQHTIFYRLQNSTYWNWENLLKTRYAELRDNYFSESSLISRFTDYSDLFTESGAAGREESKWRSLHSDIAGDVDYISSWIKERLDYLDTQYGYTTGINDVDANSSYAAATGGDGCIMIHATTASMVRIYTVSGVLVRTVTLTQPVTRIDGIAPGVYVVNDQKVLVR